MKQFFILIFVIGLLQVGHSEKWKYFYTVNDANCIVPHGDFLWIGTNVGLFKYSIKENQIATSFNTSNSKIPFNEINDIDISIDGTIWMCSRWGKIAELKNNIFKIYESEDIWWNYSRDILCDSKNRKWIICQKNELYCFEKNIWKDYSTELEKFNSDYIYSLKEDAKGNIYLIMRNEESQKILYFNGAIFSEYINDSISKCLQNTDEGKIFNDRNNNMWLMTNMGIHQFNDKSVKTYRPEKIQGKEIYLSSMAFDDKNDAWVLSSNYLYRFNFNDWTKIELPENCKVSVYSKIYCCQNKIVIECDSGIKWYDNISKKWGTIKLSDAGLPDNNISKIAFDKNGNAWIGTDFGGLSKFDQKNWQVFNLPEFSDASFLELAINDILVTDAGEVWVGRNNGVLKYSNNNWENFSKDEPDLYSSSVAQMCIDNENTIWIGTSSNGLFSYVNNKWQKYTKENSELPSNEIHSIHFDKKNNELIIANESGITFKGNNQWKTVPFEEMGLVWEENTLLYVTSITSDVSGRYCFGLYYGGLLCFENDTWTLFNANNSGFKSNKVCALLSAGNTIYIGTCSDDLYVFDGNWKVYNSENSKSFANYIWTLAFDKQGNIWIGSSYDENNFVMGNGITILTEEPETNK